MGYKFEKGGMQGILWHLDGGDPLSVFFWTSHPWFLSGNLANKRLSMVNLLFHHPALDTPYEHLVHGHLHPLDVGYLRVLAKILYCNAVIYFPLHHLIPVKYSCILKVFLFCFVHLASLTLMCPGVAEEEAILLLEVG